MASKYTIASRKTRWRALWRDDNGRQRSKTFSDQKRAEDWEEKMRDERESGLLDRNTRARETKLSVWLLEWWDLHVARKPKNTRDAYGRAVNGPIDHYLGSVSMAELDTPRIAQWRDELTHVGYTPHQVTEAMRVLSSCLGKAVERGLIPQGSNPIRDASKPPKPPSKPKMPLAPVQVEWIRYAMLTHRQGRTDDLKALRSATITSVLAYGGFRPSEALGFKVPDVDFDAGGVWVRDVFAGEHREGDTKTHAGRFVAMYPDVMNDLRLWLEVRAAIEDGLRRGRGDRKNPNWLFPDETGGVSEFTHRNWAAGAFKRGRARAAELAPELAHEILRATPYTLRGSMISVEVRAAGRDLDWQKLADRAGHTVPTLQKYYLATVNALAGQPRMPVDEQIERAREAVGVGAPTAALRDRVLASAPPRAVLIDLHASRRRRAS
jgi:integrase